MNLFLKIGKNSSFILAMGENLLGLSKFFQKNPLGRIDSPNINRFNYTPNHKTAGFSPNLLYRSMVTETNMDTEKNKKKIATKTATDVVKPLESKLTGAQVRDLAQTLIRLRERELARQEKRQTGKHLQDATIKGLAKTIELLKNLLQHGYNPGRYSYDEKDFSYSRPVRTLSTAQKENNLVNLAKAREAKAKLADQTRIDHD